ncbi:MAG: Asp-tRNA(Asn)/Glu-tRNA(Gln) amidotransferase subunit GatC [Abditibacteriales bacterium]|nr:Asp-tRNA(Asn)/Glu-tRNA(Gln) amidotransferase subunit GatC [Abditibacteriales bacterium]MDW8366397.1 Asp-tRNA(Asn)/Glu-tRNA(Gln) amidotransferase subunit GatC [Abditibacteriales bacterium]
MRLSREQVEHVALLARLELSEEEKERYMHELNQILEHFEALQRLDTENVPPTSHAIPMTNVLREDVVRPSLPREAVLQNAPDAAEGCFRVPRVVEEG